MSENTGRQRENLTRVVRHTRRGEAVRKRMNRSQGLSNWRRVLAALQDEVLRICATGAPAMYRKTMARRAGGGLDAMRRGGLPPTCNSVVGESLTAWIAGARALTWAALALVFAVTATLARAAPLEQAALESHVAPPYRLGAQIDPRGAWTITDLAGADAGYVFQTAPLAPIPGFSGQPIDVLVTLGLDGRFIDAELLSQNEPVFVSGLGVAPFHAFVAQYRGLSLSDTITIGAHASSRRGGATGGAARSCA